ncbi:cupin domain-containing protein [Salininema proteolyticum]|uniref:Cupin domain-containing protein n=1 Tax=Salininema proteolyticum TaxID=1607685 RepID=A0ABV8TXT8_9ACTN
MSATATRPTPRPRSPRDHALIVGVHGAEGRTGWKAFYTRRHLESPTEAVEWATLPPGAVSGEHRHTRTEEIYLILDGEGEFFLNGEPHPVRPGTLAMTTVGNTHGLRNTGSSTLNWWVIETLSPDTQAILADTAPPRRKPMPARIEDLTATPRVDTAGTFDGPLAAVQRHVLADGDTAVLDSGGRETAGFLNKGAAELSFPGYSGTIEAPTAFLIPAGSTAEIAASGESELYTVELEVPQR